MKKYALHPGYIKSPSDKQWHFIGAANLAHLYRVSLNDCVVWEDNNPETYRGRSRDDYIHLYPVSSGNYVSPEQKGD